jgi:acetyl-CoA C-acetyltransferase
MRRVAVVGVGHTKFGKRDAGWRDLVQEAGKLAFDNVDNLEPKDIESFFVGAAQPERFAFLTHVAPLAAEMLGITPRKIIARTELACASGQAAIRYAYAAIAAGLTDIAMVVGVEKMFMPDMLEAQSNMTCVLDREWDGVNGLSAPPFFAMCAQRHMYEYGTTREQMAMVRVKNQKFASKNELAQFYGKEFTVDQVVNSKPVSMPLCLLDCSGITDGGAAMILVEASLARQFTDTPIYILGTGQASIGNLINGLPGLANWDACRIAAEEAYRSARITPDDVDIAETHDCFTISEIIEYEELGFCKKGEGGKFVEEGQSDIGGKVVVNTRGGLLGMGHPLGATALSQAIELFWQFRGEVPKYRYVDGAEIGITHNLSGSASVHSIMIYGRG